MWPPGAHVLLLEAFWRPPGAHPALDHTKIVRRSLFAASCPPSPFLSLSSLAINIIGSSASCTPRDLRSLTRRLECDRSRWRNLDGQAGRSPRPRGFVGAPRRTAAAQRRSGRPADEAYDPRTSSSGSSRSCTRENPARDLARGPQGPGAGLHALFSRRSAACGLGSARCSSACGLGFSRCSSASERRLQAHGRLLQLWVPAEDDDLDTC